MATRYSYPIDLHEEREGGYSVTFPDFDEAFTDGDTFAEAVAEAADCPGGGARGAHRAARGHSGAEPRLGAGPRQFPVRSWPPRRHSTRPCAKSGCPTAPSRRPWVFRKARFDACSIPATPPRSAGWRKPWRASRSAWWSPWKKPPDRRWVPAANSIFPQRPFLHPTPGRRDISREQRRVDGIEMAGVSC